MTTDPTKLPDLSRTAAALEKYRAAAKAWDDSLDRAAGSPGNPDYDYERLSRAAIEASLEVGKAYVLDTADRNPESLARFVAPDILLPVEKTFVFQMVERWKAQS